ncbi:iron ABC transporter permease [Bordetella genomosp. 5]|uniref:ABC transporter permease n=1 Tax=Bordetella genomosp. 5 TaxID=1395608 RepID=UPI000B9ECFE7|nr:iron ABC transporter permease [Bordetella genomosp. 5]OZI41233.1 iron ABC transporter permease [Bordetella genomosp. 5]
MHIESTARVPAPVRWWPRRSERGAGWLIGALLIALAVAAPIAALVWWAADADLAHWQHLAQYVLPQALANTAMLLAGVGVLVTLLGTGAAWLVTAYEFPTRRMLTWALLLPLAVPTYIIAFAYLDLLHPIGPIQGAIRTLLGYDSPRQFRLPDLRSIWGAIFVLGFVLYPYVYLSTRVMFMTQAASLLEAARSLGAGRVGVFVRVALPLARPAIAVGVSLALLETLNDIGASEFLGVQTLTVSVYTTWVTRSDLAGAAQIALTMLLFVVALILLERQGRKRQRYANTQRMRPMQPRSLRGVHAVLAIVLGWIPVLLGFVAPAAYLVWETYKRLHLVGGVSGQLLTGLQNTLIIATAATVITLVCGLIVAWAGRTLRESARFNPGRMCARVASLGYAVPGTVLAIGLLTPFTWIDRAAGGLFGFEGMLLMGSMGALVCAYTIRFLAISTGGIEAGLARIPASLEQASRLLGETPAGTLRRVHLPLLRPALAAAALLVFVDTMKELPATLLLRPMNFDTLATWLYAEAARGTYEEGAVAALAIVLAGLLPVILLARTNLKMGH